MSVEPTVVAGAEFVGYRIEGLIGRGGMGVVYRAYDLRLKRVVALKLIAPELALDERFRERFLRETELAVSLEHPNVVPIHDAGDVDGRLYIAMRHVEGRDLRALLREDGPPPPTRTLEIVRQVADALDAAHARGLVHRDVKPSNILLDAAGHVYLADFGLTRSLTDADAPFAAARSLGTPAYLAPEQLEGRPADGLADVYSLGCLLYECLTGSPPFARDSRLAVAWAHLEEPPPRATVARAELPQAIDGVIAKAMAKDPDERYHTCAELVRAAEEALGLGRPPVQGRRRLLLVTLSVLLALVALVTALGLRAGEEAAGALAATGNSLVRVDPTTNGVAAVTELERTPLAVAVAGRSVWVLVSGQVLELDAVTNDVLHATDISAAGFRSAGGPMLDADAGGAWVVGVDFGRARPLLVRVLAGGRGAREYALESDPLAVAAGEGTVWVLLERSPHVLLRIDPETGTTAETTLLPQAADADSLAAADGAVFVMETRRATLHRIDARTGRPTARETFGSFATPPILGLGSIWFCAATPGASIYGVDPSNLAKVVHLQAIPAAEGRIAVGHGALWRHDITSGTVVRFSAATGRFAAGIRVTATIGTSRLGPRPTAIAAGADAIWVTVSD